MEVSWKVFGVKVSISLRRVPTKSGQLAVPRYKDAISYDQIVGVDAGNIGFSVPKGSAYFEWPFDKETHLPNDELEDTLPEAAKRYLDSRNGQRQVEQIVGRQQKRAALARRSS